ncbi:MAG: PQQ-binding-like beta-propeller repeat protein, partial [Thermomicrobiales bacterium]|nr:PQQ-binding-like beta-propeller repeat protein [Thermomicrobiales bacterium]
MTDHRLNRRRLLASSLVLPVAGVAFPALGRAQEATPVPMASGGWPFYGHDLTGTKATSGGVSSSNVAQLGPLWEVEVGGPVSATPVIAGGVVYVGSYDGTLDAIDLLSGDVVWSYATGAAVPEPNLQIPLGITGSAAVANGVVYVGDADALVHAIDAASGEAIWTAEVDAAPNASIWSSPVILGDRLYVGVASIAKEVGFRGSVVALNVADGSTVWQTHMVPEGADGAGVFAVPAIDEARGALYVGTQNAYSPNPAPYGDPISIVALDLETGERRWAFHAPEEGETAPTDDVGFSASPNLFSAEIDGETRDLVGNGQKSGDYWALDRDTGEVVWRATVSPAGFLGGMEGTSATANGVIAVPATDWPEFDGPAAGMVTAL